LNTTHSLSFFISIIRRPPTPTPFPYTTLFRSGGAHVLLLLVDHARQRLGHAVHEHREQQGGAGEPAEAGQGDLERGAAERGQARSEEHTSELQSLAYLVCRLLLEKKKTRYSVY